MEGYAILDSISIKPLELTLAAALRPLCLLVALATKASGGNQCLGTALIETLVGFHQRLLSASHLHLNALALSASSCGTFNQCVFIFKS